MIVDHLEKYSKDVCIKYLDYIIHKLNDTNPENHNKLATFYLEKILSQNEKDNGRKIIIYIYNCLFSEYIKYIIYS